jgi:hypothetical protein
VVAAITPLVRVPEAIQTRGRVPVRGTMNGFPFRSSLMPGGGSSLIRANLSGMGWGFDPAGQFQGVNFRVAVSQAVAKVRRGIRNRCHLVLFSSLMPLGNFAVAEV